MRRFLAALAVAVAVLLVPTVHAQQPLIWFDLVAVGLPQGSTAALIDADGNPATQEWAIQYNGQWRVAAIRSSICLGPWFDPRGIPPGVPFWPYSSPVVSIERLGTRDVLTVTNAQAPGSPVRVFSLDAPPCS
jgi:hypothetical protein